MEIILLHGSWHGAWCWYKVTPHLRAAGHNVHVPDLPAHGRNWRFVRGRTTLNDMALHVCDILDKLHEPALIVAHSRGGIVASTVAEMRPRATRGCVYLAAYMLRNAERVADYFKRDKDSLVRKHIHIDRMRLTDSLACDAQRSALYADCDEADVELARSLLTPEPLLPALTRLRLTEANYGSVPRHYIALAQDRAVTLELQRAMVANSACVSLTTIEASHSAYFSRSEELASTIQRIAN